MLTCVDLFSGCGGLSQGFLNAGLRIDAAIDSWDKAQEVYEQNFAHPCHLHDLTDEEGSLEIIRQYRPDGLLGGPPCQDFSSAGKRDVTLGRADLTIHFGNIVTAYRPQFFVMENVDRIRKSFILRTIVSQFMGAGYGLSSVILDAAYCGVPQARKRFFLVGVLGGAHNALNAIYRNNLAEKPMTVRDYFGDSLDLNHYYRHPRNYNRRGIFSVDEPSPTVRGVNRPVPPGYALHKGDPKGVALSDIRPLTTGERAQIQTFPKSFTFVGAKTHLEQMIGNSVPVNMAEFVGRGLQEYISSNTVKGPETLSQNGVRFHYPTTALHRTR